MREPTFLILSALAPAPIHGYAILQSVESLSDGRVSLRAGTLYAALDRMVRDGWLLVHGEEVVRGRLRKYYAVTASGIEILDQETAKLEMNALAARRQLAERRKLGMA